MSSEPWDDQPIDADVVAFGGYLRDLGDRLADANEGGLDRLAEVLERGLAGVAESVQWLAHATDPVRVPCPHRQHQHREGG